MMNRRAIIFGIKGLKLSIQEKIFFKKNKPWGVILFSRNIKNIQQVKKLVFEIKKIIKDPKYPILIDEEGGEVSRINKIVDLSLFTQDFFGNLYKKNKKLFYNFYKIYINQVSSILRTIGVNINTVPVLDVRRKKSHKITGTRSFSQSPETVLRLGKLCINFYKTNKIATVIKHIPGHGLARSDSHYKTPIILENKSLLKSKDFKPFKHSKSLFAMTAHAIYLSYDKKNTATHSSTIIKNVIRKYIKFNGILISDDISMKSLKYKLEENASRALKAGCNLVLHCNGNISEMRKLVKIIPKVDKFVIKKTSQFYNFLG